LSLLCKHTYRPTEGRTWQITAQLLKSWVLASEYRSHHYTWYILTFNSLLLKQPKIFVTFVTIELEWKCAMRGLTQHVNHHLGHLRRSCLCCLIALLSLYQRGLYAVNRDKPCILRQRDFASQQLDSSVWLKPPSKEQGGVQSIGLARIIAPPLPLSPSAAEAARSITGVAEVVGKVKQQLYKCPSAGYETITEQPAVS